MFELYDYQSECLHKLKDSIYAGKIQRRLFTLPTGCGKTVVFGKLISDLHEIGKTPSLVLAHRDTLLEQAAEKIFRTAPHLRVGIEQGENKVKKVGDYDVICASVQTVVRPNRLADFEANLCIVDEAHHATLDNGYYKILSRFGAFQQGGMQVVGCTATPKRLDRKALISPEGAIFQECVFEYKIREAIQKGYLSNLRGYRIQTENNLSQISTRAGDFAQDELANEIDNPERTEKIIEKWAEVALDRPTLVFCINIEHAEHVAELFRAFGVSSEAVHGNLSQEACNAIQSRFEAGTTRIVTNCQKWTEGVDIPCISCIILARPTKSWALYMQCVGRGTRLSEGKTDCIILDVVDNCGRHSITSLPSVLDLPANLDMEGKTITEAAELLEQLGTRVGQLELKPPKTLSEIKVLLEEVDLFFDIETPEEAASVSEYSWLRVQNGYLLSMPGKTEFRIYQDVIGDWLLQVQQGENKALFKQKSDENLRDMFLFANDVISSDFENIAYPAKRSAKYKKDPPSKKQIDLLRKFGIKPEILDQLTKGSASALISKKLGERNNAYSR